MQDKISVDQMADYMDSALEKELTTIKSMEKKEELHVKTLGQMESSAAETFASDFSNAFADFADGARRPRKLSARLPELF